MFRRPPPPAPQEWMPPEMQKALRRDRDEWRRDIEKEEATFWAGFTTVLLGFAALIVAIIYKAGGLVGLVYVALAIASVMLVFEALRRFYLRRISRPSTRL